MQIKRSKQSSLISERVAKQGRAQIHIPENQVETQKATGNESNYNQRTNNKRSTTLDKTAGEATLSKLYFGHP